jgi:hypothetical protein
MKKRNKNSRQKRRTDLTKRLTSYSVAAGAVLAAGGQANAKIFYSGDLEEFGASTTIPLTMDGSVKAMLGGGYILSSDSSSNLVTVGKFLNITAASSYFGIDTVSGVSSVAEVVNHNGTHSIGTTAFYGNEGRFNSRRLDSFAGGYASPKTSEPWLVRRQNVTLCLVDAPPATRSYDRDSQMYSVVNRSCNTAFDIQEVYKISRRPYHDFYLLKLNSEEGDGSWQRHEAEWVDNDSNPKYDRSSDDQSV